VSQESVYVAISRTRHDLKIFAEDTEFLMEQAQQSNAQQNPIELLERKAEPNNKAQVSITEAVIEAPTKVLPSPVKEHPQAQPPVEALTVQAEVEAPASRPKHKLLKEHPQPQQKPPAPKPQNLPPVPKPQPKTKRATPKPQKHQPFWTPAQTPPAPCHIDQKHWQELLEGSAIHPGLAERNVETVAGKEVYERLLSTKLEQIGGSGQYVTQPAAKLMKAYEQVAAGGWWAKAGIDARSLRAALRRSLSELQPGEKPDIKLWGSFKADNPRVDATKSQRKGTTEYIKYEHPLAEERQLFLPDVPAELAERIYNKHNIQPTDAEKQNGFWYVVHKYNLPVTVTEGAKKTLSSLSQGEVTIGLSGVNGGYFARDHDGNRLEQRVLHPELKVFATPGREFRFAFDHDTKQSTIFNVRRDMVRTGELLEQQGCSVQVLQWKADKGLDDLIVNQGPVAYAKAQAKPIPLAWEADKHYRGIYTRLSRQARAKQPTLAGEAMDAQVYRLAVEKGDRRDGARVIAQSDQACSLRAGLPQQEAQEKTLEYIQRIEQQVYHSTIQPKEQTDEQLNREPFPTPDSRQLLSSTSTEPAATAGTHRAPGAEAGAVPAGADRSLEATARELSEGLDTVAELQEVEQLPGAVEYLNRNLEQHKLSHRATGSLGRALEQFHQEVAAHPGQPEAGDSVKALADAVEHSTLEAAPALTQAVEKLTTQLEHLSQSATPEATSRLTADVGAYTQQLSAQQEVEEQQQPQAPQAAKLSPQQLWQQYSQRVPAAGSFTTALEVARLAWKDGVPEAEIRQVLQASPHLQHFGEKGRTDLVELPLAKVKREVALSKMPQQQLQHEQRHHQELEP